MEEKFPKDISVVVPVYNSAGSLRKLYSGLEEVLIGLEMSFEVIFVEDGGKDDSWKVLLSLKKQYPDYVHIIKLARNFGQHSATLCGLDCARGKYVLTIDDDLQSNPKDIEKLFHRINTNDFDIVYGVWPNKKHSFLRNFGSFLVKKFLLSGIRDGSSFRLMTAELAAHLASHTQHFLYIDQIVSWYTYEIGHVDVTHYVRESGKSNYTPFKLVRLALKMLVYYTDIPLRMMTVVGLISSILSFVVGGFYFIQKVWIGAEIGFTAIIVTIAFTSSLILFCLGIVGEYISRIYKSRAHRPLYSVKVRL